MARRWWRERGESGCDGIGKRTACGERSELPQAVPHCRRGRFFACNHPTLAALCGAIWSPQGSRRAENQNPNSRQRAIEQKRRPDSCSSGGGTLGGAFRYPMGPYPI